MMPGKSGQKTYLYLIRDAASELGPAGPPGGAGDAPLLSLTRLGIRQAEATRDFLAIRPIDHCYSSLWLPAMQTAAIVAAPHYIVPQPVADFNACVDPGEAADLEKGLDRIEAVMEKLLARHVGQSILVVAPCLVHRSYLARLLGLTFSQAAALELDRCGISVVIRTKQATAVRTLNAAFHLQGVAA
jgi:broad specificity phosphatase PhoE